MPRKDPLVCPVRPSRQQGRAVCLHSPQSPGESQSDSPRLDPRSPASGPRAASRKRARPLAPKTREALSDSPAVARWAGLFAHVGQQSHETSPLDCQSHRMLADGGATALAPSDDLPLAIRQLLQQVQVLVIDIHRTRSLPVDENRVLLLATGFRSCPTSTWAAAGASATTCWSCLGHNPCTCSESGIPVDARRTCPSI